MLELVRRDGTPLGDDELEESDVILPPPDTTLAEAAHEFTGDGPDPGLAAPAARPLTARPRGALEHDPAGDGPRPAGAAHAGVDDHRDAAAAVHGALDRADGARREPQPDPALGAPVLGSRRAAPSERNTRRRSSVRAEARASGESGSARGT